MNRRKISNEPDDADNQNASSAWWDVAVWTLVLGAFVLALVLSYREIHYNSPNDLRSPVVLLVDALLATVVAIGFAVKEGSLKIWTDVQFCLRFGLWAAAVFRLLPPVLNEQAGLFLKNFGTFDVQYVVLGAFIHGGLAALLSCPLAMRVLDLPVWHEGESLWEMCGAVILVFFVVAGVARLLAESWWQGLF